MINGPSSIACMLAFKSHLLFEMHVNLLIAVVLYLRSIHVDPTIAYHIYRVVTTYTM
jgi:hypothetical protein